MRLRRLLATLLLLAPLASPAPAEDKPSKPAPPPAPKLPDDTQAHRDLAYVADGHERQKLDLYLPKSDAKLPLVVWIHGGGWQAGNKGSPPALHLLVRSGYAVASINYRLSQHAPYPAQIQDCKAALRFLRAGAAKFNLDPDRVGVWGASAGGHLVALLGTTGDTKEFDVGANLDQSSKVQAVCDFFGPTDLMLYGSSKPNDTLSKLIGGPIQDNPAKVAKANPIAFATAGDAPFLIFHGDKDQLVPLKHSQVLEAALKKADVPVTLRVVPNAGHGFGGAEITREIGVFFDKHLKGK